MTMRIEILDGAGAVINTIAAGIDFAEAHFPGAWRVSDEQDMPATAPVFARLTKLGFRSRFTAAEKTAIELASLDDPAVPMAQRAQAADIRVYLADVASATYIDPQRPETRAGVQALEAAGLIGAGRALQILDEPIQAEEAFTGQE